MVMKELEGLFHLNLLTILEIKEDREVELELVVNSKN